MLIGVLIGVLFISTVGQAAPQKMLTINPLGFLFGVVSGEYEFEIMEQTTLGLQGMYWKPNLGHGYDLTTTGIAIGMRNYPGGQALQGFYIGGYGAAVWLRGTYLGDTASATITGSVATLGYKWLVSEGLAFDFGVNAGVPFSTRVTAGGMSETTVSGALGTSLTLAIGFAW